VANVPVPMRQATRKPRPKLVHQFLVVLQGRIHWSGAESKCVATPISFTGMRCAFRFERILRTGEGIPPPSSSNASLIKMLASMGESNPRQILFTTEVPE
jgi:hypothetical protein